MGQRLGEAENSGSGSSDISNTTSSISVIDLYQLTFLDETDPSYLYIGLVKIDGTWLLKRYEYSVGEMKYSNDSIATGYQIDTAWIARASLNYKMFNLITGV